MRVVLADDHALVRQGVRALLEKAGFEVVGEASDGQEALLLVTAVRPDVAILDIGMPLLNGPDTARDVQKAWPKTKTVLVTRHDEVQYVSEALRAGGKGYALKNQAARDLVEAIHQAGCGGIYLSQHVSRAVVEPYLSNSNVPADALTPHERQR